MQIPLMAKLQYLLMSKEDRSEFLRRMIRRIQYESYDKVKKLGK